MELWYAYNGTPWEGSKLSFWVVLGLGFKVAVWFLRGCSLLSKTCSFLLTNSHPVYITMTLCESQIINIQLMLETERKPATQQLHGTCRNN